MGKLIKLFSEKGGIEMSIFTVAKAFLSMDSEMTHKKLQKLCYYAQSWRLALYKERLFNDTFEAWVHGPVCRELYREYSDYRWNVIPREETPPEELDAETGEFLEMVYNTYGEFDGDELEAMTHSELPWKEARLGLEEWEPSNNIILEETMKSYYWNVYEQSQND